MLPASLVVIGFGHRVEATEEGMVVFWTSLLNVVEDDIPVFHGKIHEAVLAVSVGASLERVLRAHGDARLAGGRGKRLAWRPDSGDDAADDFLHSSDDGGPLVGGDAHEIDVDDKLATGVGLMVTVLAAVV